MVPTGRAQAPALLAMVLALGVLYASVAFVSVPASGAGPRLRATVSLGSQKPASSGASTGAGLVATSMCSLLLAAGVAVARRSAVQRRAAKEETAAIPRPEDLLESPKFPMFMGSTGGYMSRATRERHAITWTAKEEAMFELPTGTIAIMNKGENLCYFRKKEQCICLGKQLRKMKIENYKIYRLKKDGTVIFMHPADGVFPEKVNKGRIQVNGRPFTTCQNPQQANLKWTKYHMKSYEADPLTTMFLRARQDGYQDQENLFALPEIGGWVSDEDWPAYNEKFLQKLRDAPTPDKSL